MFAEFKFQDMTCECGFTTPLWSATIAGGGSGFILDTLGRDILTLSCLFALRAAVEAASVGAAVGAAVGASVGTVVICTVVVTASVVVVVAAVAVAFPKNASVNVISSGCSQNASPNSSPHCKHKNYFVTFVNVILSSGVKSYMVRPTQLADFVLFIEEKQADFGLSNAGNISRLYVRSK